MAQQNKRRVKGIPLVIGNDPELWRFESLEEALSASTEEITQLILEGIDLMEAEEEDTEEIIETEDVQDLSA